MLRKSIGTGLTALLSAGIVTVGAAYVRGAHSVIDGFGLPEWAEAPEPAYWVKGLGTSAPGWCRWPCWRWGSGGRWGGCSRPRRWCRSAT